ncbi:related to pre-mRNA splicing factor [Ustilago trichophora]|uniref:Related to pre-mRNA splicing factor n=1 Tax=Ustilago trichophora TaxID=86804 RepID=A0A5C3DYD8_9BASI|nr:related to pre-mRNA splicing factor [Ustilago trichophora]
MARNQEKAQSMLYRFREAQATSLGLSPKPNARRPRLASSVTSLKECERWRGDVIREISRKVSKIQDFGLTDYEVRDLNDEINKLLREKVHWENQILHLGGANYRRGGVPSMLGGDEGIKAGRGGYKYFGRAKDLPGVKELFSSTAAQGSMGRREDRYQKFRNLPASYFGDEDEDDGVLLEEEMRGEEAEWNEGYLAVITGLRRDVRRRDGSAEDEEMDVSEDDQDMSESGGIIIPTIPRPTPKPWKDNLTAFSQSFSESYIQPSSSSSSSSQEQEASTSETTKRSQDTDAQGEPESSAKRQKGTQGQPVPLHPSTPTATAAAAAAVQDLSSPVTPAGSYSIFTSQDLAHPNVPDRAAVERMILMAKKRQLRQEYIGSS